MESISKEDLRILLEEYGVDGLAKLINEYSVTTTGDLGVGDDVNLTSDSAVLSFGADSEIKVTHVADTGLNQTR